ncbi:hypothetical protein [Faecalibacterium prausnitzii]|uniref:hypothetical protein n=1 Tax=Faecalibacterium prausnitzii TaxID=853 RepID=UPI0026662C68|nr:hypothetical protein [Faecalibacterium prausnitzii]
MMKYPKNCAILTEEEMEYTTGGTNGLIIGSWVIWGVTAIGMLAYNVSISNKMVEENPDKYNDSAESQTQLVKDLRKEFFRHPMGWLIATGCVAGIAMGILGGYKEGVDSVPPIVIS